MKAPSSKILAVLGVASLLGLTVFEPLCYRIPALGPDGHVISASDGSVKTRPCTSPRNTKEAIEQTLYLISGALFPACAIWLILRFVRLRTNATKTGGPTGGRTWKGWT